MLLFVQHVHASFLAGGRGNSSREVGQLIQLIKILSSLQQYLLVVVEVIVGVDVGVPQQVAVLLEVPDLIIKIYEFLSLLLDQEGPLCYVEFHDGFLLLVNVLQVPHLVPVPLHAVGSSLLQGQGVV